MSTNVDLLLDDALTFLAICDPFRGGLYVGCRVMNELFDQAGAVVRGMWRFRWQAMGIAWLTVLLGWSAIHVLIAPSYRATAQIYADTETVLRPLMKGLALDIDLNKQLNLMARQVMSRPNLERVVVATRLDTQGAVAVPMDVAVDRLRNDLSLTAEHPSSADATVTNIYNLSYVNRDPAIAQQVVQALIAAFTESTLAEIRKDSERGTRFIEQQIAAQKEVVAAAAAKVRDFKKQHVNVLSAEGRNFYERLQSAEHAVTEVEREIEETDSRRRSLQNELDRTPAYTRAVGLDGSLIPTPLEARLTDLQEQLAQLRLKYTESHPDVIAARDSIERVEGQIRRGDNPASMVSNPTHQQLELRVREVASELAALDARKNAVLRQRGMLLKEASTLPVIEDELARLTREADAAKKHLAALETRRRSMKMSNTVDQKSLDLYFRVIEPPSVSTSSVLADAWRMKAVMSAAVFAGGLAAAAALAYALYRLAPPVFGQRALIEITGLPVFGVVSRFATRSGIIRERVDFSAWLLLLLLMAGAFGSALLLQRMSVYGAEQGGTNITQAIGEERE